jgi:hypothetical protein
MKAFYTVLLLGVGFAAAIAGAAESARKGGLPPLAQTSDAAKTSDRSPGAAGEVIEVIDTAGYTYVQVDTGEEKVWAAAPQFVVQVGDRVKIPAGFRMPDYYSKTLERSFDVVYFVASVAIEGAEGSSGPGRVEGHPGRPAPPRAAAVDLSGISKAAGGKTVGEILDHKASLASQEVTVRGRVVKFNTQIMGKNWLHLQDGTAGETGADDLTVTTDSVVSVGDTVLVRGVLAVDRDFGFGYEYDVIVEDASVTVE